MPQAVLLRLQRPDDPGPTMNPVSNVPLLAPAASSACCQMQPACVHGDERLACRWRGRARLAESVDAAERRVERGDVL